MWVRHSIVTICWIPVGKTPATMLCNKNNNILSRSMGIHTRNVQLFIHLKCTKNLKEFWPLNVEVSISTQSISKYWTLNMNKPLQVGQHVSTAPAMSRTPPDENSMTVKALQYHMNKGSPCRKSLHRSLGHSIASSKMYQYKAKLRTQRLSGGPQTLVQRGPTMDSEPVSPRMIPNNRSMENLCIKNRTPVLPNPIVRNIMHPTAANWAAPGSFSIWRILVALEVVPSPWCWDGQAMPLSIWGRVLGQDWKRRHFCGEGIQSTPGISMRYGAANSSSVCFKHDARSAKVAIWRDGWMCYTVIPPSFGMMTNCMVCPSKPFCMSLLDNLKPIKFHGRRQINLFSNSVQDLQHHVFSVNMFVELTPLPRFNITPALHSTRCLS